jgi:hypothetical protein
MNKPVSLSALVFALSCLAACAGGGGPDTVSGNAWSEDDSGESGTGEAGYPAFPTPSPDAAVSSSPETGAGYPGSSSGSGSSSSSGGGYVVDSGGGKGKGGGSSQGCVNPACTSDGNTCGCTATGSTGNVVALGCLQGGVCGCFDDTKTLQAGVFFDNGACATSASAAQAFVQYCQCQ